MLMKILVVHPAPAHTHQITSRHTCSTLVIYRSIKQRELSHCERRGQPRGNERHGRQWTNRSPSPSCSAMSASSSSSAGNDDDDDDVDDDAACCAGLDAAAAIISASSSGDGKPASAAAAAAAFARRRSIALALLAAIFACISLDRLDAAGFDAVAASAAAAIASCTTHRITIHRSSSDRTTHIKQVSPE
eukprot:COSAG06_NODE_4979_length_3812_cov_3.406679_2_plen_190_part_00